MKILLLTHTFNCLCQRIFLELTRLGHVVSVEFDIDNSVLREAITMFEPALVIAPFLKRAIPPDVHSALPCIVIHPGIVGDKGPSSLDWAILNNEQTWGVTALQASEVMDGGDIWAHAEFAMREASKSSIYRNEVTEVAVSLVKDVVKKASDARFKPTPLAGLQEVRGCERPLVKQKDRAVDWSADEVSSILRKIRSGDGSPGVRSVLAGVECFLFDAHRETRLRGAAGEILATRHGAVCVGAVDGSVWVTHLQELCPNLTQSREAKGRGVKLAAARVLGSRIAHVPEAVAGLLRESGTWQDIFVEYKNGVAYLYFEFLNGAMGISQSQRLREAFVHCCGLSGVRAVVLMGGRDFWSNGIHLNEIECSESAAHASMENIRAINSVARVVLEATNILTVSAVRGNVGSGGCFLALASDFVWVREGVVFNPHYKNMGNLYGSEYWTYVLPRRMGEVGKKIMARRLPVGAEEACEIHFVDAVLSASHAEFETELCARVESFVAGSEFESFLEEKRLRRERDESQKPLDAYEAEELAHMHRNFFGFDPSYHVARYNFVFKTPHSRTPLHLARHRARQQP